MRLLNLGLDPNSNELKKFAEWITSIGDGNIGDPSDGEMDIEILDDILLQSNGDAIATIVRNTYPYFGTIGDDNSYLHGRVILAPTLDVVGFIYENMTKENVGVGRTYLSSDTPCQSDSNVDLLSDLHNLEFLNANLCSGVPNHDLILKIGTPVMLLRNLDYSLGLCNGTRMVITKLVEHFVEAKIISRSNAGQKGLIHRLSVTPYRRMPIKFQRRQFSFIVSYAMTINKSQGQSLNHAGLLLKKPIFSHYQLYVVVFKVTNHKGLKILIFYDEDLDRRTTTNIVYKKVFQNL